jgi:hypothetical protein
MTSEMLLFSLGDCPELSKNVFVGKYRGFFHFLPRYLTVDGMCQTGRCFLDEKPQIST